jgi:hypothetical protein
VATSDNEENNLDHILDMLSRSLLTYLCSGLQHNAEKVTSSEPPLHLLLFIFVGEGDGRSGRCASISVP